MVYGHQEVQGTQVIGKKGCMDSIKREGYNNVQTCFVYRLIRLSNKYKDKYFIVP